ncbi:MAG TPA: hypothetical protein VJ829_17655 [Candidatus Binatia bacterium]|nr:hypothetical protein [Candidatus Binatia bacterium]
MSIEPVEFWVRRGRKDPVDAVLIGAVTVGCCIESPPGYPASGRRVMLLL